MQTEFMAYDFIFQKYNRSALKFACFNTFLYYEFISFFITHDVIDPMSYS